MTKTYLIDKSVPEVVYNAVSDYVWDNCSRVNQYTKSGDVVEDMKMDVDMSDVFIEDGKVFVPVGYVRTYKGTNDTDDTDEYKPVYSAVPNLTSEQVEDLVVEYQD